MRDAVDFLNKKFQENMPCTKCNLSEICKHSFTINRPNYNDSIFDIKVTCKIKEKTINKIVDATSNSIRIGVD